MSDNTVDYSDKRVDAGGDKAYDSSNYGTTTGDLTQGTKPSSSDFGSGASASSSNGASAQSGGSRHPGLRASGQDVVNHEQWGENKGTAGQQGGLGTDKDASVAPTEDKELSSDDSRFAQGYTKSGDMNPDVGA